MKISSSLCWLVAAFLALPVVAQQPETLLHSIPAPLVGVQSGAQLGHSVAEDGGRARPMMTSATEIRAWCATGAGSAHVV